MPDAADALKSSFQVLLAALTPRTTAVITTATRTMLRMTLNTQPTLELVVDHLGRRHTGWHAPAIQKGVQISPRTQNSQSLFQQVFWDCWYTAAALPRAGVVPVGYPVATKGGASVGRQAGMALGMVHSWQQWCLHPEWGPPHFWQ